MPRPLLLNHCVLLFCASIHLGTGVFLVFFQLPPEASLTVETYRPVLVEPAQRAGQLLVYTTIAMFVTGAIMLLTEWFSGIRWVPVVVMICIAVATLLMLILLSPLNSELTAGIQDPARLNVTIQEWTNLNRIRTLLWAIAWSAMMYWFYRLALQARADR